ncbi:MAG: PDZ domain-containing protein [Gemmatimonadaceae bacterium]
MRYPRAIPPGPIATLLVAAIVALSTLIMTPVRAVAAQQESCRKGGARCDSTARADRAAELQRELDGIRAEIEKVRRGLSRRGRLDPQTARALRAAEAELSQAHMGRLELLRAIERGREEASRVRVTVPAGAVDMAAQMAAMARLTEQTPDGWLGIVISSDAEYRLGDDGNVVMFSRDYPVVEAIEPGSPADRAGVLAGDVILAYAGRDVRGVEIPIGRLLQPGKKLPIRIRRAAGPTEIVVTVGERPAGYPVVVQHPDRWVGPVAPRSPRVSVMTPSGAPVPAVRPTPEAAGIRPAPLPPEPPAVALIIGTPGTAAIGGAEVTDMGADLRDVLGVDNGVLVLTVGRGTPASRAGLRGGDVIVEAAGERIDSPAELLRIARRSSDRSIGIEIVRKGDRRVITFRW